ncbi:hypothetical protein [Desulfofundulus salinus]|uniref:hypothetical protein n=1 Tax=Desulfofundulus salinus TaxID=2419843 RepID=UPI0014020A36|nr:hypothetical protein [Desulfofundulus salinum]
MKVKVEIIMEVPHWFTEDDIEKDVIQDFVRDGYNLAEEDILSIIAIDPIKELPLEVD